MTKRKGSGMIERLSGDEAKMVLRRLLDANPDLQPTVEGHARGVLGEVSFEAIADEVEDAIQVLELDDLGDRAGEHADGYTSPSEAAGMLLEEAVEPFVQDMKRRMEMGHKEEALEVCKGIVLGLYRMRKKMSGHEFRGWAEDFPGEHAGWVFDIWSDANTGRKAGRRGAPKRWLPADFVEEHLSEWSSMAAPKKGRAR